MPSTKINGFDHYYEDVGSGPVLVMLHGAGASSQALAHHFDDLSKDFRVIAPDMRAMGKSEHVPTIPPGAWVDDLAALFDELSIDKAFVHGVSLGSRVALRFTIEHQDRVRGLILDAPIIAQDAEGNASVGNTFNLASYSEERKARLRDMHGDDWAVVSENYLKIRNTPELQEYYNLRASFPTVKVPVLIMRGDIDDSNHKLAYTYELHKVLEDSRLAIVPRIGFGVSLNRPEIFRMLVREFAEELAAAPAR